MHWYFNVDTRQVEPEDEGAPNARRLGPFETAEEAARALDTARRRTERWDAEDAVWDGEE